MSATCKKNDYVVLEEKHSFTDASFKTTCYSSFHIARVESATRAGIATKLRKAPAEYSAVRYIGPGLAGLMRVHVLPAFMQKAALQLYISHPTSGFQSEEGIKTALRFEKAFVDAQAAA